MAFTRREQLDLLANMGNADTFGAVVQRAKGVSLAGKIKLLAAWRSGAESDELVALITAEPNGRAAEPPADPPERAAEPRPGSRPARRRG